MRLSQEVPEKSKDSPGGPWQFIGLLPLFDPPRHDSAETIRKALVLGVNVKMITGTYTVIPILNLEFCMFGVNLAKHSYMIYFR